MSREGWFTAVAALVPVAGCEDPHITFLDPQGPVAAQQRTHFLIILGLMMIIVLPVIVLTPWLGWRYRHGKHNDYKLELGFAWKWELLPWGAPAVTIAILAEFLWRNTLALDPYEPLPLPGGPLRVQAIGFDWKWLFVYPGLGIASVDELAFPADRQLALELTSETVMQAFFIPALRSQIYAMGGHGHASSPRRRQARSLPEPEHPIRRQEIPPSAVRSRRDE